MGKFDNLNDSQLPDLIRRLEKLERGTPMNSSAIGRGGIEVYQNGTINVSDGNLIVNGTATISGVLNADGTVTLSGTVAISGPLTISGNTDITGDVTSTGTFTNNGPTNLNGATKTTGTLSVEGVTTLKNDLNVTTGGKITAGNTRISPSASNGGVEFISGGGVGGSGGVVAVRGSGNAGLITNTTASVFAGSNSVDVSGSDVTINGPLKTPGLTSTANAANVYFDPTSKQLYYKP
jgi:hypothetical protein